MSLYGPPKMIILRVQKKTFSGAQNDQFETPKNVSFRTSQIVSFRPLDSSLLLQNSLLAEEFLG